MQCVKCKIEKADGDFRLDRHPCRKCETQRHKEWRAKNREHLRQYDRNRWKKTDRWDDHIRRKYGISVEEYNSMLEMQHGKCAICGSVESGGNSKRFHVDHDHLTGAVRGLLCSVCNQMLGYAQDDVNRLAAAIRYLRKSSPRKRRSS